MSGKGSYFNWIRLLTQFGSGIALIGLARIAVDFVVLYLLPNRQMFSKLKYKEFDDFEEDSLLKEPILYSPISESFEQEASI